MLEWKLHIVGAVQRSIVVHSLQSQKGIYEISDDCTYR
jgi:hypothetical protein